MEEHSSYSLLYFGFRLTVSHEVGMVKSSISARCAVISHPVLLCSPPVVINVVVMRLTPPVWSSLQDEASSEVYVTCLVSFRASGRSEEPAGD